MTIALHLGVAALVSWLLARSLIRLRVPRLWVTNVRGRRVPVVLGLAAAAAWLATLTGSLLAIVTNGDWDTTATRVALAAACWLAVVIAGFTDDLLSSGPRGLRGHLASAIRGKASTGVWKVLVIGLAAVGMALLSELPGGAFGVFVGAVLIAGSANVWNGLDVVPGRSGKWFAVVAIPLAVFGARDVPWILLLILVGAALPLLGYDLRERGMLGDTGSNLLGFAVGCEVAVSVTFSGLVIAAVVVVGLNLLAETVTFSRIISAVPPLRWFDRLGRRPPGPDFSSN